MESPKGLRVESKAVEPNEWRSHWTMLIPSFIGIMLFAMPSHSLGVMVGPLERSFGWTRAEISSGPFIIAVIALLGAPLAGTMVDRLGPRRIALIGLPCYCLMLALLSTCDGDILTWWLLWTLLGITAMMIFPALWTAAISSLFIRHRGKSLAIALCGTGMSMAVMPPATNYLVEAFGWRAAYVVPALVMLAIAFPLTFCFFRSAHNDRGAAAGASNQGHAAIALQGVTARAGFVSRRFFILAIAVTLFQLVTAGLIANQVPILIAFGLTPAQAAAVAGLMGVGAIVGRLVGGVLLDRFDAKKVAAISVLMPCVTILLLLGVPGSVPAAMLASLLLGLAGGTELDACAYLAARHFGLRSLATLFGTLNGLIIFASGLSPMLANIIFDITDSYRAFLWMVVPGLVLTAILFLRLGAYPDFDDGPHAGEEPAAVPA